MRSKWLEGPEEVEVAPSFDLGLELEDQPSPAPKPFRDLVALIVSLMLAIFLEIDCDIRR